MYSPLQEETPGQGAQPVLSAADVLERDAKKLLQWNWCCWFPNKRRDDAQSMFEKAAAMHKQSGEWQAAARCFILACEQSLECGDLQAAFKGYRQAGECLEDTAPTEAATYYGEAAELCVDQLRWCDAGKMFQKQAAMKMKACEATTSESAIHSFRRAIECFGEVEPNGPKQRQAQEELAGLRMQRNEFAEAAQLYRQVANTATGDAMSQWGVSKLLVKSVLAACLQEQTQLAQLPERPAAVCRLRDYTSRMHEIYVPFQDSKEHQLIEELLNALESGDQKRFQEASNPVLKTLPSSIQPFLKKLADVLVLDLT